MLWGGSQHCCGERVCTAVGRVSGVLVGKATGALTPWIRPLPERARLSTRNTLVGGCGMRLSSS